jgi:CRISPR-associated protein Cas1
MTTLYVREPGAVIRRSGGRLMVEKEGTVLQTVRLRELERVALFGNAEMTAPAMRALLEAGVETTLLSPAGRYLGRLAPAEGKNVFLRLRQFQCHEDREFRLLLARRIVAAKLRNSRALLLRHARSHPSDALRRAAEELADRLDRLDRAASPAALMGMEGDAARVYFGGLALMIRGGLPFAGRSRRPPRDAFNALLSFTYTLLTTELTGAVAAEGFDPHVGFLHEPDYGRPSLALDLLEEFRAPVGDRLALSLANRAVLRPEHFEDLGESGVRFTDPGRTRFLEYYYRALEVEFTDRPSGERLTFRRLMLRQARRLRRCVEDGNAEYVAWTPEG